MKLYTWEVHKTAEVTKVTAHDVKLKDDALVFLELIENRWLVTHTFARFTWSVVILVKE